jgi:hypothetical protein
MSYRSSVNLTIAVVFLPIVDFLGIVPIVIGRHTMLGGYRGSPGNQSFTLAGLLVTGEA